MNFAIQAACPECGHINNLTVRVTAMTSREMHTCDSETCGQEFVVETTLPTPSVKVLKLTEVTG